MFQLQHLFSSYRLKNWWCHSDVTACCSGLGSGYFMILKEYPLRNNNQQSNFLGNKKPKDLKYGLKKTEEFWINLKFYFYKQQHSNEYSSPRTLSTEINYFFLHFRYFSSFISPLLMSANIFRPKLMRQSFLWNY